MISNLILLDFRLLVGQEKHFNTSTWALCNRFCNKHFALFSDILWLRQPRKCLADQLITTMKICMSHIPILILNHLNVFDNINMTHCMWLALIFQCGMTGESLTIESIQIDFWPIFPSNPVFKPKADVHKREPDLSLYHLRVITINYYLLI